MADPIADPIKTFLGPFNGRRAFAVDWKTKTEGQKGYQGGIGILDLRRSGVYLKVRAVSDEGEDIIREIRIAEGFEVQVYKDESVSPRIEARYLF